MALRRQFSQLLDDLRAELGRTNEAGVRVADLDALKKAVNEAYEQEFDAWPWRHLKRVHTHIDLAAGQRYYDFPSTMDWDAVEDATVWYNNLATPITRGIGFEQYNVYSSENDDRSDPVIRWDVKFTGSTEQIEVWPLPSSNDQDLQFIGSHKYARLVNDSDQCLIDDQIVVLCAAQAVDGDRDRKIQRQSRLDARRLTVRARDNSNSERVRLGGLNKRPSLPREAVIRISG